MSKNRILATSKPRYRPCVLAGWLGNHSSVSVRMRSSLTDPGSGQPNTVSHGKSPQCCCVPQGARLSLVGALSGYPPPPAAGRCRGEATPPPPFHHRALTRQDEPPPRRRTEGISAGPINTAAAAADRPAVVTGRVATAAG